MNKTKIKTFLQQVKNRQLRGEVIEMQLDDSAILELSVSTFEYGQIHLRMIVDDSRLSLEEDTYYQRTFTIDSKYEEYYTEIVELVESENESGVSNAHSWVSKIPKNIEDHPSIPYQFSSDTTIFFEEFIQLREPLSITEALETNRS